MTNVGAMWANILTVAQLFTAARPGSSYVAHYSLPSFPFPTTSTWPLDFYATFDHPQVEDPSLVLARQTWVAGRMGLSVSFARGDNNDKQDDLKEYDAEDDAPMPGRYNIAASPAPLPQADIPVAFPGAGPGSQHEIFPVPPQFSQFNLQGSNVSGNPMFIGGNMTQQVVNIMQPEAADKREDCGSIVDSGLTCDHRAGEYLGVACAKRQLSFHLHRESREIDGGYIVLVSKRDRVLRLERRRIQSALGNRDSHVDDNMTSWGWEDCSCVCHSFLLLKVSIQLRNDLRSRIIEDLESVQKVAEADICVVYAYCRYTEPLTVKDILEGIVRQCLERHPDIAPLILPVLQRHRRERTRPSVTELVDLLRTIEEHFDIVFYVIDGLDEARITTQFDLVKVINSLGGSFALTSRPLKTLENDLHSVTFYQVCADRGDIQRLVKEKIQQHSHLRGLLQKHQCEGRVVSQIVDKSGGMFIHAALQVQALVFCKNLKDLEDALNNLPVSLEDMYRQTVQRIRAQLPSQAELGIRALLWVAFSHQPLRIEDLLYVVATDPGTFLFHEERMVDKATLVSACCGLIEWDDKRRVRFVLQEALPGILLEFYPHPHANIVQVSIQRLISFGLPQSHVKKLDELHAILKAPLVDYAYHQWRAHFRHCEHIPEVSCEVLKFLKQCTSFPLCPGRVLSIANVEGHLLRANSLHLAAVYDFTNFVPRLVTASPDGLYDVNSVTPDPWSLTPLSIACWLGHATIIQELVVYRSIDPNIVAKYGTALRHAVQRHSHHRGDIPDPCPILTRLLQVENTDVNATDQWGKTALIHAVTIGSVPLVEQLLRHPDVDVNVGDNNGNTALIHASGERGSVGSALVRLLLQVDGIQVNAANRRGQTALIAACDWSHHSTDIVEQLLKRGDLDVNAANAVGDTALICAVRAHDVPVVRLLLQVDGIQVNAANRAGQTALIAAWQYDYHGVDCVASLVQELLKFGDLDVNVRDGWGNTPLIHAARRNIPDTVNRLLQSVGIQVNVANGDGHTALMVASRIGHGTIVKQLLQFNGINVVAVDGRGNTAACLAAEYGRGDVVEPLFQAQEAVLNMPNDQGQTPLILASSYGHANTVLRLIQSGKVDLNAVDHSGSTALAVAFAHHHWPVVVHLLQADRIHVNTAHKSGYDEDSVDLLLRCENIDVNVKNIHGETALMWASYQGHSIVVERLLGSKGIEVNSRDGRGRSAMMHAARCGNEEVVKLLLQSGKVDVDLRCMDGRNATLYAVEHGHERVLRRLEDYARGTRSKRRRIV
ncbi:ankyrin repeat domain-containing protein 50 [Coprinopsis cinerea okayama7|uniref:Ankyrin repeat domain-containing protein 50 n=1 Tax=Coprinopsis cinerea (strain Okayama-7 / 130 / ATCC MYA-4618 / FGSC 9003) TaxID=240176 RepID=A8NLS9_COPC7|nr:ankyrin repeat domain-containing protein 50 [Coprinopsis cinerea okayama7\|eukprot:XP_001834767.2 ankyrin repeat domain-containing protein 50 [Coprinopsis cinerea okayama7\